MVKTMTHLREEVAERLRETLHGKEVDMLDGVRPRIPHMLGITPLDETHEPDYEKGRLLDPKYPFWSDYHRDIETRNAVMDEIETAVRTLVEDEIFELTYPYGTEAEIIYCEVDEMNTDTNKNEETAMSMKTSCRECGTTLTTQPELVQHTRHYNIKVSIDCPQCTFSQVYEQAMVPR
jgi:hypothetical protein